MKIPNLFKIILILSLILVANNPLSAATIFQSATMGPTGQYEGWIIDDYTFLGSRFYIAQTTQVTAIGGHLAAYSSGGIFGAIISLTGSSDFPNGYPFSGGEVIAHATFSPNNSSSDFRTPLSVTLNPGYYAIVFGSGWYGALGSAIMPYSGQSDIGTPSYIGWDGSYYESWLNAGQLMARFVVEGTVVTSGYCSVSSTCDEYISSVFVGTINNSQTSCSGGYSDYTALSTAMQIGSSYPITITNGNPYPQDDYCAIWIDWNQDKDFTDAGETITMTNGSGAGPYTATIVPPAGAVLGNTRMRIRISIGPPTSCGAASYGETEDYTINVTGPQTGYCTASANCAFEYISGVQVGSINNTGTSCSNGYADYTALSTAMLTGSAYPITITNGNPNSDDLCAIWIDWNHDLDFSDVGETITMTNGSGVGPYTATISPPADALTGNTRMRIRIAYKQTPVPCGALNFGETEDYTIIVSSQPTLQLSGYIKSLAGIGISGVTVTASTGQSTTTNASGYYALTLPKPWSGTITPAKSDRRSNPTSLSYTGLNADTANVNFTGFYRQIVILSPIADTYVKSNAPTTNYGANTGFSVSASDGISRTYLKFDLSSIPTGYRLTDANLSLDASYVSIPSPTIGAHYLPSDTWDEMAINWNNAPTGFNSTSSATISSISIDKDGWIVTANVATAYNGDGLYSVVLKSEFESVALGCSFWSKESPLPSTQPQLIITYEESGYGGGTGEPNNPYLIYTPAEMNTIGKDPNDWNKAYKLMADIDLSAYQGQSFNIIGSSSKTFSGFFDGNWHTISNFSYNSTGNKSYLGLFGIISGRVTNLGLINPSIIRYGGTNYAGALAGQLTTGVVTCCWVSGGSIAGDDYVGGLFGSCSGGYVANCWSSAQVNGRNYVGGLIGSKSSVYELSNCYSQGNVTGQSDVGGLFGYAYGLINNCYSTGSVSGSSYVGGLAGYADPNFTFAYNLFWDTTTSGQATSAIGIGKTRAQMQTQSTFVNSGWDFAGELTNGPSDDWIMPPCTTACYYPILWYQLSPWPAIPSFAAGSGTSEDPYQITTELELRSIGHNPRLVDKHFVLMNDLTLSDANFPIIGNWFYPFTGGFNGNGYKISNLNYKGHRADFVGMFGYAGTISQTGQTVTIKDLILENPRIATDISIDAGGLCGMASFNSEIINCHTRDGNITGYQETGGLIGYARYCDILRCSSTGKVLNSYFYGGGLTGRSYRADINDCYANGDVNAIYEAGGLIGLSQYGNINRCYAAATINCPDTNGGFIGSCGSMLLACFCDATLIPGRQPLGNVTDGNVQALPRPQVFYQSTYTNAGWDFVDETVNGTEDIWKIDNGNDYPRFAWEQISLNNITIQLDLSSLWMYQNLPNQTKSNITAQINEANFNDPMGNNSYTFYWIITFPNDVTIPPTTISGGSFTDLDWTFAATGCNIASGLSNSGQTFKVKVTIVGDDFGNFGVAEKEFGIALLGDINNDGIVNVTDRSIANTFWRTGVAGKYTFKDCDLNCDGTINVTDRSIANSIWRGALGSNSVSAPCPLR